MPGLPVFWVRQDRNRFSMQLPDKPFSRLGAFGRLGIIPSVYPQHSTQSNDWNTNCTVKTFKGMQRKEKIFLLGQFLESPVKNVCFAVLFG